MPTATAPDGLPPLQSNGCIAVAACVFDSARAVVGAHARGAGRAVGGAGAGGWLVGVGRHVFGVVRVGRCAAGRAGCGRESREIGGAGVGGGSVE